MEIPTLWKYFWSLTVAGYESRLEKTCRRGFLPGHLPVSAGLQADFGLSLSKFEDSVAVTDQAGSSLMIENLGDRFSFSQVFSMFFFL